MIKTGGAARESRLAKVLACDTELEDIRWPGVRLIPVGRVDAGEVSPRQAHKVTRRGEREQGHHGRPKTGRVRLTIPAKAEYITLARLALTAISRVRPLSDETLSDLKLALTEACTNSVRHAYREGPGGDSRDRLRDRARPARRRGHDDGEGFEPADLVR